MFSVLFALFAKLHNLNFVLSCGLFWLYVVLITAFFAG